MYHFITGYTAKVAGTERGVNEPQAAFSPCFGGPFLTLHPLRYAELLKEKLEKHGSTVYLVNTGWVGGSPSSGANRISIKDTRNIITSILNGSIEQSDFITEDYFNLSIPTSLDNVNPKILNPVNSWSDKELYINTAKKLADMFKNNFNEYGSKVEHLKQFGPKI
jgi:phosphoenolpyruvate carboxykinase (ATP)